MTDSTKDKSQSILKTQKSIDKRYREKDSRITFNTNNSRPQTNILIKRPINKFNEINRSINIKTEICQSPKKSYRKSNIEDIKSKCEYINSTMDKFLNNTI